ncbi:MAG: phage scaffolding protein [Peptostreptococcus porci]|uniref:phage scaffolding protein n=1 Tax=Peptostreptococcus porci TaxID=2652282 RepID=UPI002A75C0FA|nr:phage scaffolding protein [Peptostreptococcus porci]MDY2793971.1 phage scaffolding protein [Peptostreptococcus porci]MDY5480187.1 phage scaffolding protein [Peptostreptococcus porci]
MEWLEKILKDVENKDEMIKSIKDGIGKNFVSKEDFNTKNEEVKTLKGQLKDRDDQLGKLKDSNGDIQDLKDQIEQLQKDNLEANEKYQSDLKDLTLTNAIKLAIAGKVHDEDLVSGLINKSNVVIDESGKVIGLDDQIKSLQESKAFLFKSTEDDKKSDEPGFKFGTGGDKSNQIADDALRAAFGLSTGKDGN